MTAIPSTEAARYKSLSARFNSAIVERDIEKSRKLIAEITKILRPVGQETKLNKFKLFYFEMLLDCGDVAKAKKGFSEIFNRLALTRTKLEAAGLRAVCHLRDGEIEAAEKMISFVIGNENVIPSKVRRIAFKRNFARRFEAEGLIAHMRGLGRETIDVDQVAEAAMKIVSKTNSQLTQILGDSAPGEAVLFTRKLNTFIQKQLPSSERLLLRDKNAPLESEKVGNDIFDALKHQLYEAFCNEKSDTYKSFFNRPLKGLAWSSPVAAQVVQYLKKEEMCWWVLAVPLIALFLKLGVNTLCEHHKPQRAMIDRR